MADDHRREQISAALDGEGPMPEDLDAAEQAFVDRALALRARLRIGDAGHPPDVTGAVLEQIPARHHRPRARLVLSAAAVFVVAALIGAIAVRPGGPVAPRPAAAGIAERVIAGQRAITRFDATITVVEHGVHPDVPERTLTGSLHYEAPEQLWLHLDQRGPVTPGWPANDIDLVLGRGTAWLDGLDDCPVGAQPACLHRATQRFTQLPPFAPTWVSPLDLIVPTDAFLPAINTPASEDGDTVVIDTTVARIDRLIEGLTSAGAIRSVHATDHVRLQLDAGDLTLRQLTVTAADNLARTTWAATNGYRDTAGREILRVQVVPTDQVGSGVPPEPTGPSVSAGFTDQPLDAPWPTPAGFTLYRTGVLVDGGARTEVYTYRDGRAWLRIDVTDDWHEPRLFGALGPLVRAVPVGDGVGYADPAGTRMAIHGREQDLVITGSVGLDALTATAATTIQGIPIDPEWPQASQVEQIPVGALVPPGEHLAVDEDGELIIAVGGPGSTGFVLTQAPAVTLPPPVKGDVVQTVARGLPARYAPRLGTLTWLEDGWRRELQGAGLDLARLQAIADSLTEP